MSSVEILIADDHELFRRGLRSLIESRPDWRVCGEASDGREAVEKAKELKPHLVLLDLSMPEMNGLEAARLIRQQTPDAGILIVSQNDPHLLEKPAIESGAKGFIQKSKISQDLFPAIEAVVRNGAGSNGNHRREGVDEATRDKRFTAAGESEKRFREMIDALPAAIYTTDAEGGLTHFNPAAVKFSGRVPELGSDQWCVSWKMFRPDGTPLPHDECPMAIALKEGRIIEGAEAIVERPDGTRRWFMPYPTPLRDSEGKIVGGINMLVDITERKEAERASSLLAAIVDSSDDAIISKNLDGIITSWNQSAERMFGYTAEEAVGRPITLIIPPDRRDEEANIIARLRRGERVDHIQTVRRRKDGTTVELSLTISPVKDFAGRVIGASKVARDISERQRADRALRATEERFRAIVETTPECVKLVAADGTLLHMNVPGLQMVGAVRAEEVLGNSVYNFIAPEDRDKFRAFNEKICRGERGALEFDIVGLEGTRRHVETHAAPLRNPDGSTVHLGVTRDISERKQAEEALQQSQSRLAAEADALRQSEERFRTLSETLDAEVRARTRELEGRNAHMLRQSEQLRELSWRLLRTQDEERRRIARELHDSAGQTLAVLSMNLTQLLQQANAKAPEIVKHAELAERLVQQLHREIRTTSYLLHPPLLDESGLASALAWYTQGLSERSGLKIDLSIPQDFGRLPRELEMVVFRLVQESLTNIHRHSGANRAFIRIGRVNGSLSVAIEDDGKGMPPEKLSDIQSGGFGVGIRGMRERVRQFQGDLSLESDPSGTKVLVSIPLPEPSEQKAPVEPLQAAVDRRAP